MRYNVSQYQFHDSNENQQVLFEPGTSILDSYYNSSLYPTRRFWVDEDYDWIENLGIHKEQYLPVLRSIVLTEHSSCLLVVPWITLPTDLRKLIEWDTPRSVREAFEGKDVHLEVLVRTDYSRRYYTGPKFRFNPSPRRETNGNFPFNTEADEEPSVPRLGNSYLERNSGVSWRTLRNQVAALCCCF